MITQRQIGWAAGFLEGEGTFTHERGHPKVSAAQMQREPLDRLALYFGGTVRYQSPSRGGILVWRRTGVMARSVMLTLYTLMSPRRKAQIATALAAWRSSRSYRGLNMICVNGHRVVGDNARVTPYEPNRTRCRECWRKTQREYQRRRRGRLRAV